MPSARAPSFTSIVAAWRLIVCHSSLRGSDELHRPARLARQRGRDRLGAEEGLRAERAAHRRADDPDPLLRDLEDPREVLAQVERRLRPGPDLEPVAVPAGDGRVRLHVRVVGGRGAERLLDDDVRLGEARVDVAVADRERVADVRARLRAKREVRGRAAGDRVLLVDERRAGLRGLDRVEDGGQLLVVDLDERGCLLGLALGLCGDGCDGIADEAGAVDREHGRVLDLAAVPAQPAHVVGRERDDAVGHGDGEDAGVRVERADDARVQHPGQLDVLGVAGGARDPRVGHAASSSSARRTSTAITRRRYSDEPAKSEIGSIAAA